MIRYLSSFTVGRAPDCQVRWASQTVSRRHARFFLQDGAPHVEDAGSTSGIWVNQLRASDGQRLYDGDQVRCGAMVMTLCGDVFVYEDDEGIRREIGLRDGSG